MLPEIAEIIAASVILCAHGEVDIVRLLELHIIFTSEYPAPKWAGFASEIADIACLRALRY